ncbi:MAG: restriction endonuclease [Parcubacteria group bacterium]|jgi:hypothetical protein|nr:restriction endonuclease [Parcubacteria group bacterium]|tara:strand:- start:46 stop:657 length:612 start_codon:yes stop_codon:yes gene_type:complete
MKTGARFSHLNGYEWLMVHEPDIWDEVEQVIHNIDASKCKTKISKEKSMKGKLLYSPEDLNKAFKAEFNKRGWEEQRTDYWVTDDYKLINKTLHEPANRQKELIEECGKTPIKSYNQTDFVRNKVAVEVQLAKYSFIPYDMFVKHLSFYIGNIIDVGIEIVPMKVLQSQMSSGPGYYESALYDLARQGRTSPPVPLILIGVEP